jgi:hypothetical protein
VGLEAMGDLDARGFFIFRSRKGNLMAFLFKD